MLEYHKDRDLGNPREDAYTMFKRIKKYPEARTILDIGMGKGYLVNLLNEDGRSAYGIDMRNFNVKGTIVGDALSLPFKDNSFDMVVEHMLIADLNSLQRKSLRELEKVVLEAKRVLKPRGIMFCYPFADQYIDHFDITIHYEGGWGIFRK